MKTLKFVIILSALVGLVIAGCSDKAQSPVAPSDPASLQKVATRQFIGTNNPTGEVIEEAIWKFPDGKILFYKYVGETDFAVNFPDGGPDILSGAGVVEINGITDLTKMTGQWHGKFTVTPDANAGGGIWQMTWHGTSTFTPTAYDPDGPGGDEPGPGWLLILIEQGHGEGGSINGMQCRYVATIHANPEFTTYYADVEGSVTSH